VGCAATIEQSKQRLLNTEQLFTIQGRVTAILPQNAPPTQPGSFFMQGTLAGDADRPQHSGIFVYMGNRAPGISPPEVGELVTVSANYADFFGQAQLTRVRDLQREPTADAVIPYTTEILELSRDPEPLESTVVCVENVLVVDVAPVSGPGDVRDGEPTYEFLVAHEEAPEELRINDILYRTDPFPALADAFDRICGVFRYANGQYKLEPRGVTDLDRGPPRVIAVGPPDTYLRVGHTGVPVNADGTPLSVFLNSPAPAEGLDVLVETADLAQAIARPVHIEPFEVHGSIEVEALNPTPALQLTARTANQQVGASSHVELVPGDASATTIELLPAVVRMGPDNAIEMTVVFDVPSLNPGFVTVTTQPAEGLTTPLITAFPADTRQVRIRIASSNTVGSFLMKASAGALISTATVEVTDGPLHPIVNEVNADMSDVEDHEFVEIFNPQPEAVSTEGWVLELMNGSNGEPYDSFNLESAGPTIPGNGYLVVGDGIVAGILPPGTLFLDVESRGNQHDIQNGNPDGARLMFNGLVMDSMAYGGHHEVISEGPGSAPDDPNDDQGESISRCSNGTDTNDNEADFRLAPASPGAPNSCP
jgi:hypothetical protein